MIQEVLRSVVEGQDLAAEQAYGVMMEIMSGEALPSQMAGLLTALRMKGETVEEITGFAQAMRDHAVVIKPRAHPLVDTCGTGGDVIKTFNVSTAAALVAAGAGVTIAKHGNRSVTSRCGSADVLEALDVKIDLGPAEVEQCIDEVGIGFMFAPLFHPAMKHALPTRQELAIRTVFNILGPLTNPARAHAQVLGVPSPALTETMAGVLRNLGIERALVVHGLDGLDEISNLGETQITEVRDGRLVTDQVAPEQFGMARATAADIRSGTPRENAALLLEVFDGEQSPARDIVLLNAAAAIVAGALADDLSNGVSLAARSLDDGQTLAKLKELQRYTNRRG
ncbi:anthranilate phosphoribosyltransferase [candidate division KD3-62 bacterium DG_56]|uniref:Anthranilate phosphoribosyltransferase n=1 Tax=candidate division KD3-62 bacterium DG_56 TaxID=1704032 RepID=A0A0S7XNN0_9BACT|nr:MAG: anthranilate phosphoribosyltransferase [candidate division KD3-62 bacterium DG_56]